jgi:hypothetical protein
MLADVHAYVLNEASACGSQVCGSRHALAELPGEKMPARRQMPAARLWHADWRAHRYAGGFGSPGIAVLPSTTVLTTVSVAVTTGGYA